MRTTTESGHLARDFTKIEKSAFNPAIGVRVAFFVAAPIAVGVLVHQSYLLFMTLGAFFLAMTEGQFQPSATSGRPLVYACFTEACAVGIGTVVATTGTILSPILLGIALFVIFPVRGRPRLSLLGTFTAIAFAFGVGIPGASLEAAEVRASFVFLGCLWALLGFELHRLVIRRRKGPSALVAPPPVAQPLSTAEALRSAFLVAIACAIGYSIGFALGLPRDYWVVATIIFTVRPSISLTTTFTALMSVGTIIGALIAAAITLTLGRDAYALVAILFPVGFLLFSSRGVNFGLTQIFVSSFIITLLNIAFPGEWYLALYRIVNVGIGLVISLVVVELLGALKKDIKVP